MFKNGEFDGFGRYEDLNVHTIYEGNFSEGQRSGFGKEYGSNNAYAFIEYEGHWFNDQKHGLGEESTRAHNQSEINYIEGKWLYNDLTETLKVITGSKEKIKELNSNSFIKLI